MMNNQISISEAARRFKKSRTTLHKLIKSGQLHTKQVGQAKTLAIAELVQVLGEPEHVQSRGSEQVDNTLLQHEIDLLKKDNQHQKELLAIKDEQITDLRDQVKRLQPIPLLTHAGNASGKVKRWLIGLKIPIAKRKN